MTANRRRVTLSKAILGNLPHGVTEAMLKYYLTTFSLSLIVLLRSVFSADVSSTFQFLSLMILIFSSAFSAIELKETVFKNFDDFVENDAEEKNNGFSGILSFDHNQGNTDINLIRIGHLLHLANPKAEIAAKSAYALGCAHEQMPDKIFVFHQLKNSELNFITGIRGGQNRFTEKILPHDPLVEEIFEKINGLIDIRKIQRTNNFENSLPYKRKADESQSILFPVSFFGQIKGILTVISSTGTGFSLSEKKLLIFFAESFSILLENHELFEKEQTDFLVESEQRLCHELFMSQLPDSTPILQDWEIAVHCRHAANYSGDFHDFYSLPGNKCMLIIGKTSGPGIDAAIFFTRLKTMIKTLIDNVKSPADLLNQISVKMSSDTSDELFSTIIALQITGSNREIQIASAGHANPIINRCRSGFAEQASIDAGVPLGLFTQSPEPYANQLIQLLPGDGLFLYTDGITNNEHENGQRISVETMKLTMEKLPEMSAAETLDSLVNQMLLDTNAITTPSEDQTGIYLKVE